MKGLWLAVVIGSLIHLCSCIPEGYRPGDIFSNSSKQGNAEEAGGGTDSLNEPYYMPAETIRDAVIDLLWARSIPYTEKRESGTIETDPVVPNRVEGWRQKMSEGDCETVFRVRIDSISQGKSQLSIQVLFPPSELNRDKSCEKSAGLLRDRLLDEVHNALMTGQPGVGLGGRTGGRQANIMAVAVRSANIRSGPTTQSKVVTRLGYGSKVVVLERQREWVRLELGSEGEAWIHGTLLEDVVSEDAKGEEEPGPEAVEGGEIGPTADTAKPEPKNDEQSVLSQSADTPASRGKDATGPPREGEMPEEKVSDLEDREKGEAAGDPEAAATADPAEKQTAQGVDSPQRTPQTETPAAPPPPATPLLVIRDGKAIHVFRDPNVFSPKIGKIEGGARIASFEKNGNFFKVSHGGLEGYVYKDFCKIQE